MTKDHIKTLVRQYANEQHAGSRYASFDFCFNYFRGFKDRQRDLATKENIERSCLHIGFFLASWGMFRMSGKLGQEVSMRHFRKLIEAISTWNDGHKFSSMWEIDANDYENKRTRKSLCDCFEEIGRLVVPSGQKSDRTLVTKVMLGIFGCVPAFDTLFTATFRQMYGKKRGCAFNSFNEAALVKLADFYRQHSETIAELAEEIKTLDFETGNVTRTRYTQAKIIDMIGFQEAKNKADEERKKRRAEKAAQKQKTKTAS